MAKIILFPQKNIDRQVEVEVLTFLNLLKKGITEEQIFEMIDMHPNSRQAEVFQAVKKDFLSVKW
jgi:hypothetical protein